MAHDYALLKGLSVGMVPAIIVLTVRADAIDQLLAVLAISPIVTEVIAIETAADERLGAMP